MAYLPTNYPGAEVRLGESESDLNVYLDGMADQEMGEDDSPCGHIYMVENRLVQCDSDGFKRTLVMPTEAEAEAVFKELTLIYSEWYDGDAQRVEMLMHNLTSRYASGDASDHFKENSDA